MAADQSYYLCLYILCFFIPPLSVGMVRGCGGQVCLNIFLCFLFFIPAIIHGFIVVSEGQKEENAVAAQQQQPPQGQFVVGPHTVVNGMPAGKQ